MTFALGVDIGGTKIQFCRIEDDMSATPLGRTPTALMRRGTPLFASDLANLIHTVAAPDVRLVGVSLNGILDRGTVVYSSLMGGRVGFPLGEFLRERLGCEVRIDDDIHAMTAAEAALGGGDGEPFAMVNLGTGIGVGLHDGAGVLRGRFAAGLISEQAVWVDALAEHRSLDRTVCGRGVREVYERLSGHRADAVTVFARDRDGDRHARQTVSIFATTLGRTFQMVSRFYHPARIVVNGSIKAAWDRYGDAALETYRTGLEASFHAAVEVSGLAHAAEIGTVVGLRTGK